MTVLRHHRSVLRRTLALLALVAVALRLTAPAGYMPGTSLRAPIMLCSGQGPMPGMAAASGRDRQHPVSPHDGAVHGCAFAEVASASLHPGFGEPGLKPVMAAAAAVAPGTFAVVPGRGLAAPPPPSHAPPAFSS